jgi:hypothetical protein
MEPFFENLLKFFGPYAQRLSMEISFHPDYVPILGHIFQSEHREIDEGAREKQILSNDLIIYPLASDRLDLWYELISKDFAKCDFSFEVPSEVELTLMEKFNINRDASLKTGELTTLPDSQREFSRFRWCFIQIPKRKLLESCNEKFQVALIAEALSSRELGSLVRAQRWIRPFSSKSVRTKDAWPDFCTEEERIRPVKIHPHYVQYITPNGIRIFDNRNKRVQSLMLPGSVLKPVRIAALNDYVWKIITCNRQAQAESRFIQKILSETVLGRIQHSRMMDYFSDGHLLLTDDGFIHAEEIFGERKFLRSAAFRDIRWERGKSLLPSDPDIIFNPHYVVIK